MNSGFLHKQAQPGAICREALAQVGGATAGYDGSTYLISFDLEIM